MNKYPLGRLVEFDERSRSFPIRALLGEPRKLRSYTWRCLANLDQKSEGACVGFSIAHELIARPSEVKDITNVHARAIYKRAQMLDEWPGENYEGTSVLGGMKALQQLYPEAIKEYRWGFTLQDVLETIAYRGPIVLGVNWYNNMFAPDDKGFIHASGRLAGGHAILAKGINAKKKYITLHNSWGESWGINGSCYLSFDDLKLLLRNEGEACIPVIRSRFKIQ